MNPIRRIWEYQIMKQDFVKQLTDASTIQQIINLVNRVFSNIGIILITAWSGDSKVKDVVHRNPYTISFCVLLCNTLLYFEAASIAFAVSRFRLI